MAAPKVKIAGKSYAIEVNADNLTLGELEFLEEQFGLDDMREFNWFQPKQMVGIASIAVQRVTPELDDDEIVALVRKGLKGGEFYKAVTSFLEGVAEKEADPQPAGANGTAPAKARKAAAATTQG